MLIFQYRLIGAFNSGLMLNAASVSHAGKYESYDKKDRSQVQ